MYSLINIIIACLSILFSSCSKKEDINRPEQIADIWVGDEPQDSTHNLFIELIFTTDGHFSVTWNPFETYYDYWGSYEYDNKTGALVLVVESGHYIPKELDLNGTVKTNQNNELVLLDMYLGEPNSSANVNQTNITYIFRAN